MDAVVAVRAKTANLIVLVRPAELEGEKVFADHGVSGTATTRPGLDRALKALKPGDTLVVWKPSRPVALSPGANRRRAGRARRQHRKRRRPFGAAHDEFERSLTVERTRAGLMAAKRRGQKLGRKPSLAPAQVTRARNLIGCGESPQSVAVALRIGRTTLWRALKTEVRCSQEPVAIRSGAVTLHPAEASDLVRRRS